MVTDEYRIIKTEKRFGDKKVILDFFYLNPHIQSPDDFESLRMNAARFWELIDEQRVDQFVERIGQKRLMRTMRLFLEYMKNA